MTRDNKDKTYSFRDTDKLIKDISKAAYTVDMRNSEFMRWAIRKAIREVNGNGEKDM
jgi:hypothetical protein